MKKVLIIFTLLISGVSFGNVSVESKIEKKLDLISETANTLKFQACDAVCRVTVTNTDTGETTTITGYGYSALSCDLAAAACLKNAVKKARDYILSQE